MIDWTRVEPLLDGVLAADGEVAIDTHRDGDIRRLTARIESPTRPAMSVGVRLHAGRVRRYLRNGYHSWDGSWFELPGTRASGEPHGKEPDIGFAVTALLSIEGAGAQVIGFARHDRFQTRFRFHGDADAMAIDVETLLDATGASEGETLLVFDEADVEEGLRRWSRSVAGASPIPPRIPAARITGWCSWYNLYASIDAASLREELAAAAAFRDDEQVPLDIFQIDDGFTPEMGDWLEVKPQFPGGMKPLLAEIAAEGFRPGLWIAPFMVGNRSRLAQEHPDWLVTAATTGTPLVQMRFYGEFRWHKRSEEYHILDITHPGAEAYMRRVMRTWAHDWGARYFKADFLLFGSEHGPDTARWHVPGLSRIAIWRRMLALMREEIGDDALLLGCGCPLWASVGLVDAVRIGRDVGVTWGGVDQSAQSLLRDQSARNHAAGILWQADPDCVLLRDRYHQLTDEQLRSLALFAGNAGGVLMTSDSLAMLPPRRRALFAQLLRAEVTGCDFSALGNEPPIIQRIRHLHGDAQTHAFNPTDTAIVYEGQTVPAHGYR